MSTATLTERESMLQIYSDFHKEAYGFRPRGFDYSVLTTEQLQADFDRFAEVCRENAIEEELRLQADLKSFDLLIARTIQLGASDYKTALKWLFDGENLDWQNPQDLEHFVWRKGILFSDKGKAVLKDLEEIFYS